MKPVARIFLISPQAVGMVTIVVNFRTAAERFPLPESVWNCPGGKIEGESDGQEKVACVHDGCGFCPGAGCLGGSVFSHEEHEAASAQVEASAEHCPVSGEEVGSKIEFNAVYEEKVYNLCYTDCVAAFTKNPQKFLETVGAQDAEHHEGHDHQLSGRRRPGHSSCLSWDRPLRPRPLLEQRLQTTGR